jgi:hypothetical protein
MFRSFRHPNLLPFPFSLLDRLRCHSSITSMVSSYFHFFFVALIIFAVVDAQHIRKLHRSPNHRTRCRPRLASSTRALSISPDAHAPVREVLNGTFSDSRLFSTTSTTSTVLRRSTKIVNKHSPKTASITRRSTLTPNNVKAGIAGGDAYPFLKDYIGWWYDWCASVFFLILTVDFNSQ